MKIALLNLPFDNNYGGNLQRYALIKVLQNMGHKVEHINLQYNYYLPWYKWLYSYPKRLILKYLLGKNDIEVFVEQKLNQENKRRLELTSQFYDRYIPHTGECVNIKQIQKVSKGRFDAYIVGSDQVWRKGSTKQIGLKNYFLHFTNKENVKRFAYAISFGVSGNLLGKKEISTLAMDYAKFDAVSVREMSALKLLEEYGWNTPKPTLCLDPTLLLTQNDYKDLIEKNEVENLTSGKIFCYILDETDSVNLTIDFYSKHLKKRMVKVGLDDTAGVSICQWLNNIRCSDFVITDSYHGCVFSVIFNRPFVFLGNKSRGNSRIESLFNVLGIKAGKTENIDYQSLNEKLEKLKEKSIEFISKIC